MEINKTQDDGKKEVSSDLGKGVSSDPKAVCKESVKTADNQSHADSNNKAEGKQDKPKKAMSKKKAKIVAKYKSGSSSSDDSVRSLSRLDFLKSAPGAEIPKAGKSGGRESDKGMANAQKADDAKGKADEPKDLPKDPRNVVDEDSDGGHSSGSSDFSFTRKTRSHAKKSDASGPSRAPKSTACSKGTTQRGGTRSNKAVKPKDPPAGKESDGRVLRDLEESIEGALEEADELQKIVGRLDRISKADKEKVGRIVKNLKGHANRAKHALDEITVGKIQGMISTEVQMAVEKAMRLERARVVPGKSYSQSVTPSLAPGPSVRDCPPSPPPVTSKTATNSNAKLVAPPATNASNAKLTAPTAVKNGKTKTVRPAAPSAATDKPGETKDSRTKPSSGRSPKGAPEKVPRAREVHVPSIGKVPIRPRKEAGFTVSSKEKTGLEVMKEMTKVSHLPTKMGVFIKKTIQQSGKVRVIVEGNAGADKLAQLREAVTAKTGLETGGLTPDRAPRVVVYDVAPTIEGPEVEEAFKLTGAAKASALYSFRNGRNSKGAQNWVVEVDGATRNKLVTKGRLNIGWTSSRVGDHAKLTICRRCLGFGHIATKCPAKEARCGKCAGRKHEAKDCKKAGEQKCALCLDAAEKQCKHSPGGKGCAVYEKKLRAFVKTIDYQG
ncbi:uncharacterized protein LOC103511649 [Diaphorina citri]|uniref:Uncharacterized protein LOC103511649 n=1 Tax=Diaphorina citri TaxID=121845 RepID=A0A3Q0IY31_DIACI|nr:uncharacterized protein LOC103511649 [Diaphorina citri]